jgi:hypothetical protein
MHRLECMQFNRAEGNIASLSQQFARKTRADQATVLLARYSRGTCEEHQ